MTASKDMSRPTAQHRPSAGPSSLPVRSSNRAHSHTISAGGVNPSHRVNRRKSSTFSPAANAATLGAAVESGVADGSVAVNRRSSTSKGVLGSLNEDGYAAMPSSLPPGATLPERAASNAGVLVDGPSLSSFPGIDKSKQRRRASDGTRLTKKEKAATGDLKCEHCGKAYKHGSCLSKHRWEHTPQWQYTSKLLISKHQQVQLLEAASVLVGMNGEGPTDSDNSSSPAASGSSERDEEPSSTETTPPPPVEGSYQDSKRLSNNSSAFSRSYQSVFSEPGDPTSFGHQRQWSASSANRPQTGNTSIADSYRDEDPQDLAAAVGLLSCSYGTPKSGATGMPSDVPPVPPLPEKYAKPRGQEDAVMESGESDEDEDEGVFGKMDA